MTESDFSCPCIIGYGSSPSRCGPPTRTTDGQMWDIPGSNAIHLRVMCSLTPAVFGVAAASHNSRFQAVC
jgi:hypothetical protein